MKLQLSQLQPGENRLEYNSEKNTSLKALAERISQGGHPLQGPFGASLQLTKLEPDYYLRGRLWCTVEAVCARCAESFPLAVDHRFELGLLHLGEGGVRGASTPSAEESEELDLNVFEGPELDLEPVVEEQFYLSLPLKAVCRDNCLGVCQSCGQNKNEGSCACGERPGPSPFDALKKLKI